MIKALKTLVAAFAVLISIDVYGQTLALTVTGRGETEEQATKLALRSALEQAFGVYVSSNTELSGDILVKDEVVAISTGNIKSYEILTSREIAPNDFAVSVIATVSVDQLKSYTRSMGGKVEFEGALFAENIRQMQLRQSNETLVIRDMITVLADILNNAVDHDLTISELPMALPKGTEKFGNAVINLRQQLENSLSPMEEMFRRMSGEMPTHNYSDDQLYKMRFDDDAREGDWYVEINVDAKFNQNIESFREYLRKCLQGISLSDAEVRDYRERGVPVYPVSLGTVRTGKKGKNLENVRVYLRSEDSIVSLTNLFFLFRGAFSNFLVRNNLVEFIDLPKALVEIKANLKLHRTLDRQISVYNDPKSFYFDCPEYGGSNIGNGGIYYPLRCKGTGWMFREEYLQWANRIPATAFVDENGLLFNLNELLPGRRAVRFVLYDVQSIDFFSGLTGYYFEEL